MPIPADYREIVRLLSEKTEEGALNWTDNSLQVSAEVNASIFRVWAGVDEQTNEWFVAFGLFDADGKVLDSWYLDESDDEYQVVHRLYREAKRHAAGVPTLLKNLADQISAMSKR
jgi:hypothetical protein